MYRANLNNIHIIKINYYNNHIKNKNLIYSIEIKEKFDKILLGDNDKIMFLISDEQINYYSFKKKEGDYFIKLVNIQKKFWSDIVLLNDRKILKFKKCDDDFFELT